ncbi:hypothetical protein ABPG74_017917 [Tetrahymena malaccensis]
MVRIQVKNVQKFDYSIYADDEETHFLQNKSQQSNATKNIWRELMRISSKQLKLIKNEKLTKFTKQIKCSKRGFENIIKQSKNDQDPETQQLAKLYLKYLDNSRFYSVLINRKNSLENIKTALKYIQFLPDLLSI